MNAILDGLLRLPATLFALVILFSTLGLVATAGALMWWAVLTFHQ